MDGAFLEWWQKHYSMANLAVGAASDAWDAAILAERERCATAARHEACKTHEGKYIAGAIEAAIRTPSTGAAGYGKHCHCPGDKCMHTPPSTGEEQ